MQETFVIFSSSMFKDNLTSLVVLCAHIAYLEEVQQVLPYHPAEIVHQMDGRITQQSVHLSFGVLLAHF